MVKLNLFRKSKSKVKTLLLATFMFYFFASGVAGFIFLDPGGGGGGGSVPDTTPPARVTGLSIDEWTYTEIEISWDESGASDFNCYKIYRNYVLKYFITSKSSHQFVDVGLTPGSTYMYQVSAEDISGNEGLKSVPVSRTLEVPAQNALQLEDFYFGTDSGEIDPCDKSTWTTEYKMWLETFTISKAHSGYFPGNVMGVTFQPIQFNYDYGSQKYDLDYIVTLRGETDIGGGPFLNSFPAPWLDDNFEYYDIPAPMFIKQTAIKTTLLPNNGIRADLQPTTILTIEEAASTSLPGYYEPEIGSVNPENIVYDGQFKAPLDNYHDANRDGFPDWWNKFGDGVHGDIAYATNNGHVGNGIRMYNSDGGTLSAYSNLITNNVQGEGNLIINYWGKRSSSDIGNDVGVKLIVTYYDDSIACVFPEELQMTHRDGIWHNYQYSYPGEYYGDVRNIKNVRIKLENNELGSAYFDGIYVTAGWWECRKVGDWILGDFDDTYYTFLQHMEWADTLADYKYYADLAIQAADEVAEATGTGWLGTVSTIAGHLLNPLEIPVQNLVLEGGANYDYSSEIEYIHYTESHTGDPTFDFAVDDMMRGTYTIREEDFINNHGKIQLQIDVELSWGYCWDPDYLDQVSWDHTVESAGIQLIIELTNIEWDGY